MDRIPIEWINKIFDCLALFYGERFTQRLEKTFSQNILETMWQSALTGLTYDEIKRVLVYLKRHAQDESSLPPHAIEFWRLAKGIDMPIIEYRNRVSRDKSNPEIVKRYMDEIRQTLGRKIQINQPSST